MVYDSICGNIVEVNFDSNDMCEVFICVIFMILLKLAIYRVFEM